MSLNTPSSAGPPPPIPGPPPPQKRHRTLLYGCGALLALLLLIAGTVAITIWWIQRPIRPVVLSAQEKAKVDEKLRIAQSAPAANPAAVQEPRYAPGAKQIRL